MSGGIEIRLGTVLTLQRITSEYLASEDRFRLSGATEEGTQVSYWVTQRLLLRLLSYLLDWLENHRGELASLPGADMPLRPTTKPTQKPAAGEVAGPAAQEASSPGAEGAADAPGGADAARAARAELLHEADIRIAARHITLVFKPRNSEHAQLSLQLDEAWRWVAILHTLWQRAEWNLSIWPDWIEQAKSPGQSASAGYLH